MQALLAVVGRIDAIPLLGEELERSIALSARSSSTSNRTLAVLWARSEGATARRRAPERRSETMLHLRRWRGFARR